VIKITVSTGIVRPREWANKLYRATLTALRRAGAEVPRERALAAVAELNKIVYALTSGRVERWDAIRVTVAGVADGGQFRWLLESLRIDVYMRDLGYQSEMRRELAGMGALRFTSWETRPDGSTVVHTLLDAQGKPVGSMRVVDGGDRLVVSLDLAGQPPVRAEAAIPRGVADKYDAANLASLTLLYGKLRGADAPVG